MRNSPGLRDETYEQWRARMLAETGRFVEWGLAHPEQVPTIPAHPVGRGRFSERLKAIFWTTVLRFSEDAPD